MRNIILCSLAIIALAACSKKNNNTTNPTTTLTGKTFYCKIDGKEFSTANGRYYKPATFNGLQIVGDTTFQTLEIYLPSESTGTYKLTNGSQTNLFASLYVNAGNKIYKSADGEVVVTKSDGSKMSGTFHYTAKDTAGNAVSITDGEFNDIPKK